MSLAAAASPSCRFLSPSTAARRRFLHHLLAAPPRPPQLRRCSPYHWMAVIDKSSDGSISTRNDASVRYVPLTSRSAQLQDS
ncbi:unnamed protein product [Triticum turgidum subsp. durum]|uniref:Uncharacterized protein n=1 Tax=Triticum turgidum subsp. durum TaxID=4567 RepID=A0A9R1R9P3_TRITD|nr:unnamed protein product [Triticum turgidum subsp. durum]